MAIEFKRKCCATCTFWGGDRDSLPRGTGAKCKSSTEKGTCNNPKSSFKKKEQSCSYGGCHAYDKWSVLSGMK